MYMYIIIAAYITVHVQLDLVCLGISAHELRVLASNHAPLQ